VQNPVKKDKLSAYGILQFKGYGVYDKDNSIIFPSPSDPATINKFKGIYFSPTQADGEVKVKLNFEKLIQYLDAKNTAKVSWQDGFATGKLIKDSIAIDSRGIIIGKFDNDKLLNLGQLALAVFANEQGLAQDSATTFTETVNSGKANIGRAGENNRGNIVSSQLEMSNVDLAEEFTNLIIAQRAFEANSRTILTVDHILRTLIEMKR
jgi:flagellar hook protein FlgE